jgi:hypothetical protein
MNDESLVDKDWFITQHKAINRNYSDDDLEKFLERVAIKVDAGIDGESARVQSLEDCWGI